MERAEVFFGQPFPALSSGGRPKVAGQAAGQTFAVIVDLDQRLLTLVAASAVIVLGHFFLAACEPRRRFRVWTGPRHLTRGCRVTVTKSYVTRNYGVRDRIIDNLGAVAAVLVVGFVLLYFAGVLDFGRDISVTVNQASMQSPPHR
jgi:hypothetical protein